MASTLQHFRAKYSTPFGPKYLSCKANDEKTATAILKNKTPWRRGWVFDSIVPNKLPSRFARYETSDLIESLQN